MNNNSLSMDEIGEYTIQTGIKKVSRTLLQQFLLAVLAGMFVALGAIASNTAIHDIHNVGLAKTVAGVIFPVGLFMVVIAGADLFTGNCLISMSVFERKVSVSKMVKNLIIVYVGNFVGAITLAAMQAYTGMFDLTGGALGGLHIKYGVVKTSIPFGRALVLGIMCNIVVCIAIWMMYSAKDVTGKIIAGFFPIFAFVISGFEHSVANMYYIPAALFAKANPVYVEASHITQEALAGLTWQSFFINNLIPVTIGNFIGGSIIVSGLYWLIIKKKSLSTKTMKAAKPVKVANNFPATGENVRSTM